VVGAHVCIVQCTMADAVGGHSAELNKVRRAQCLRDRRPLGSGKRPGKEAGDSTPAGVRHGGRQRAWGRRGHPTAAQKGRVVSGVAGGHGAKRDAISFFSHNSSFSIHVGTFIQVGPIRHPETNTCGLAESGHILFFFFVQPGLVCVCFGQVLGSESLLGFKHIRRSAYRRYRTTVLMAPHNPHRRTFIALETPLLRHPTVLAVLLLLSTISGLLLFASSLGEKLVLSRVLPVRNFLYQRIPRLWPISNLMLHARSSDSDPPITQ
jgi:hypothetical protein